MKASAPAAPAVEIQRTDLMELAERLAVVEHALYMMANALSGAPARYDALSAALPEVPDAYFYGLALLTADVARELRDLDGEYVRPTR